MISRTCPPVSRPRGAAPGAAPGGGGRRSPGSGLSRDHFQQLVECGGRVGDLGSVGESGRGDGARHVEVLCDEPGYVLALRRVVDAVGVVFEVGGVFQSLHRLPHVHVHEFAFSGFYDRP